MTPMSGVSVNVSAKFSTAHPMITRAAVTWWPVMTSRYPAMPKIAPTS